MAMAGQTINDRLLAARHSLAGQGLAKSVCKATTEECIGPKLKHLDYLVHCTNEPNVSIPHLANLLIERSQNSNWVVVYKALITTHHLMAYGNERFMQYLASSNSTFNLSSFLDKGGVQGGGMSVPGGKTGYDMSPFIRRYAKYLNEKSLAYRAMAFDFCKVKRGKEEGSLRTMNADKLLKTLPVLQAQLDALLEFDCQANDLRNDVINMSFLLLFRDLIRLFACYNDGIINLLEKYFDMNKKLAREGLELYKKFLVRMDRVGEFLKVAENIGIEKGDIPDLTKAPSSLLDALEQHLAALEGRKLSAANTPTQTASNQKNVKSAVSVLSSTSSSFGNAAASSKFDTSNGIDEQLKAQALAEEEAVLNQYKSKLSSPTSSGVGANAALTNPFLSSPPAASAGATIVDLFSAASAQPATAGSTAAVAQISKASDDLLQLGNPFADMFDAPIAGTGAGGGAGSTIPNVNTGAQIAHNNASAWMRNNGFNGTSGGSVAAANAFVSDSNFSSVFGNAEPTACEGALRSNPFFDLMESTQSFYHISDSNAKQTAMPIQSTIQNHQHSSQNSNMMDSLVANNTAMVNPTSAPANVLLPTGFDALGDVLKPGKITIDKSTIPTSTTTTATTSTSFTSPTTTTTSSTSTTTRTNQNNHVVTSGGALRDSQVQLQQQQQAPTSASSGKLLTGDLDSSLMSLVENLNINKSSNTKPVQWNSPKNTAKPGTNWTPQPMAATTGAGYRPMAHGMTVSPAPITINHPFVHASYPVIPNYMQQGMPVMGQPMMGQAPLTGVTSTMATPVMMMPNNPVVSMPPPPPPAAIQPNSTNFTNAPRRQ